MIRDSQVAPWFRPATFLIWAVCAAILLWLSRAQIADLGFRDPDDALRLVQVRDWMAGQSWFDVTQYRINPPGGGPMHWSRLVDVPIATLLWLATPLLGHAWAERVVLAVYPLLVLGLTFLLVGGLVRRLAGPVVALIALVLLAMTFPLLIQFNPMRIDHHGWQIAMAALALYGSQVPSARKSGIVSGIAVALWLNISSEALPYAALFGALYGLKYLIAAEQWERLAAYLLTLSLVSTGLMFGTHGWAESLLPYCDAMSPPYVVPLWTATLLFLGLKAVLPGGGMTGRFFIAGLAGAAALVPLFLMGRQCLAGPFETLDPFVYRNWYLKISEGLPLWRQSPETVMFSLTGPVLGLIGYVLAIRGAREKDQARPWLELLILALGAVALSVLVLRAMAVSNLYMLPGNVWLFYAALVQARAIGRAAPRIVATVAAFALVPAMPTALLAHIIVNKDEQEKQEKPNSAMDQAEAKCVGAGGLRGLGALPASTLFAPLDIGPMLLVYTHHSVIATNHHRNQHAMAKVLKAFMSNAPQARSIVLGTGADYLVYCHDRPEIRNYVKDNKSGLAALLEAGKPPVWLVPLPMRKGETIRVYRVVR